MGFKRTSEGRVFFQNGNDGGSNTIESADLGRSAPSGGIMQNKVANKKDSAQLQILSLLKALNDKLSDSQMDRKKLQQELETYKMMVVNLQDKTEKQEKESKEIRAELSRKSVDSVKHSKEAEKLTQEAFKEFEEARRLIAEIEERAERTETLVKKQQIQVRQAEEQARLKWDDLKKKSKKEIQDLMVRIDQTEQSQKALDERIEEAANQTLKLDRKLEKTIQDRSRLIRKLERIEETVLQTHEAMNARAMVLLTDQATASQSGMQHAPALGSPKQEKYEEAPVEEQFLDVPWWRKPMRMQAVSVSVVVIIAALIGWGISEIQKPEGFGVELPGMSISSWQAAENAPADENWWAGDIPAREEVARNDQSLTEDNFAEENFAATPIESEELAATSENPAISEFDRIMSEQADLTAAKDDIGAIDLNNEDQLLALLEDNPDALAAELNNIEPSSIPPVAVEPESSVSPIEKQRSAIIELNEDVDLPSELSGTIYERIKADKNLPATVKEIENAAFSGNAEAQHDLAAIYIAGHGGIKQDYSRASLWFEEAAHNGIANARYNLGVLYHQGIGVKQDTGRAFEWYKAAAALGHPEAQYNLGIAFIEGIGVPYDPQQAAAYFESAANSGVMEAAYNLGLIHENGLLGQAQPDSALLWYKRASDQGSPEAKAALEQLAKTMGMSISDVNKMIDGMGGAQEPTAQKKTKQLSSSSLKSDETAINPVSQQPSLITLVQRELIDMGLYPGPADGLDGMITRDAVRAYQSRNNLPVNGEISEALLEHMRFDTIGKGGVVEQGSRER